LFSIVTYCLIVSLCEHASLYVLQVPLFSSTAGRHLYWQVSLMFCSENTLRFSIPFPPFYASK